MIDKEKVICGLEIQLDDLQKYADNDQPLSLTQEQAQEIICLLKEQEPIAPSVCGSKEHDGQGCWAVSVWQMQKADRP